ncbi:hypothetical protein [Paenarthrobacter ilicis]|uniref:Lipoprotein n=1 Tax=Paenarthrobacter ilicis TaxID=43665 RepID=A0ABX0TEF6_9MICC|nr:hypothetical protein [Paenarthrobacter ilicis]MBM7794294.1 hypothetical protein [Paenarthrobacter ilicis]NIJ00474.1 hypothetical protein [Paenarthrobacter ilicis]
MGSKAAHSVTSRRPARAAVALVLVLCGGLTACEYTYDGDAGPGAVPTSAPSNIVLPPDPALEQTVMGDELEKWARSALPESQGKSFYSSSGYLSPGEAKSEQTVQLPSGTYAVTLACRGTRRVMFSVNVGEAALVDLTLGCASARVSVVQLEADAVLSITVGSRSDANFAYRVSKL